MEKIFLPLNPLVSFLWEIFSSLDRSLFAGGIVYAPIECRSKRYSSILNFTNNLEAKKGGHIYVPRIALKSTPKPTQAGSSELEEVHQDDSAAKQRDISATVAILSVYTPECL